MWLPGFMNFIWPKPRPKASAELSPIHRKMFDAHMERVAKQYENERPFVGRLMDAGNVENRAKRHCAIRSVTYKDFA